MAKKTTSNVASFEPDAQSSSVADFTPDDTQPQPDLTDKPVDVSQPQPTAEDPFVKHIVNSFGTDKSLEPQQEPNKLPVAEYYVPSVLQQVKDNTNNHTATLAKAITDYTHPDYHAGQPFTDPNSPVNQGTDPHGDPSFTGSLYRHMDANLENQKQAALASTNPNIVSDPNGMGFNNKYIRETNQQFADKKKELFDATSNTVQLQLYNKYLNKVGVSPELDKDKTPIQLGVEYGVAMGFPGADQVQTKLNSGLPLTQQENVLYGQKGTQILRTGAVNAGANGQTTLANNSVQAANKEDKQIVKDNPEYFHEQKVNAISNQIDNNTNAVFGSIYDLKDLYSDEKKKQIINKAAKELGIDASDVTPEDLKLRADIFQKGAQGFFNATGGTLTDLAYHGLSAGGKLLGIATPQIDNYFKNGGFEGSVEGQVFTGQEPETAKSIYDEGGFHGRNVAGEMASTIGMIASLPMSGEALKGVSGTTEAINAANAAGDVVKATQIATKADKLANFTIMGVQGYNSAYQNALKMFGDKPEEESKRQAYSTLNGLLQGAIFSIDPKLAIGQDMIGMTKAGKTWAEQLAKGEIEKKTTTDAIANMVKESAEHTGAQIGLAAAQKIAENGTDMLFDPKGNHNLGDNVAQTAITTGITMALPSIVAGINHERAQTPMNKSLAYDISNNPDKYSQELDNLVSRGTISKEGAQVAQKAINDLQGIQKTMPPTHFDGTPFGDKAKQDFTWLSLQQKSLEQQAGGLPEDSPIKKAITKKQNEISKKIQDIWNQEGDYTEAKTKPIVKPPAPKEEEGSIVNNQKPSTNESINDKEGRQVPGNGEEANNNGKERAGIENEANTGQASHEQQESRVLEPESANQESGGEEPVAPLPETAKEKRDRLKKKVKESDTEENIPEPTTVSPTETPENKKYSPFEAVDLGNHEGEDKTKERQAEINDTPNDKPFGGTGETFTNVVDRIKKDVDNAKDGQAVIAHSGIMKIVDYASKHGWDDIEGIRKAYDNQDLAEPGEVKSLKFGDKEIHFIRHGESQDNIDNKIRGKDTPLTDKGREQAKEIAPKLQELGVKPTDIIHSELPRAKETFKIVEDAIKNSSQPEQKIGEQGSEPEHTRVGPQRQEAPIESTDSNSGERSEESEKVNPESGNAEPINQSAAHKLANKIRDHAAKVKEAEGNRSGDIKSGFSFGGKSLNHSDVLSAVAAILDRVGNVHLAIREFLDKYRTEDTTKEDEEKVKSILSLSDGHRNPLTDKSLSDDDKVFAKEYGDTYLNEIHNGETTFEKSMDEIHTDKELTDKQKSDIADHISFHTERPLQEQAKSRHYITEQPMPNTDKLIKYMSGDTIEDVFGKESLKNPGQNVLGHALQNFVEFGQSTLKLAREKYNSTDVVDYGRKVIADISRIPNTLDDETVIKKLSALQGLHGELQKELRIEIAKGKDLNTDRVKEINKLLVEAQKPIQEMRRSGSLIMNTARAERIARNDIMAQFFQDRIISDVQKKALRDYQEIQSKTAIDDEIATKVNERTKDLTEQLEKEKQKNKTESRIEKNQDKKTQKEKRKEYSAEIKRKNPDNTLDDLQKQFKDAVNKDPCK